MKTSVFAKIAVVAFAGLMAAGSALASGGGGLQSAGTSLDDTASLQRGAKLYFNYCSGCHSLQFLRYSRIAEDLNLDPAEVEKSLVFTGAKVGEHANSRMPHEESTQWFGKAPPDLSLIGRSRGEDWIYSYLKSFYLDPTRPLGWNNAVFENASMPNPLWELQGLQVAKPAAEGAHSHASAGLDLHTPGSQTPEQFDRTVRDITAFLQYAAEPAALQRKSIGVWVMLYLALFTFIAYLLKKEFWKDVH